MNQLMPGLAASPTIHPMFTHFPIVLVLLTLLAEAVSRILKSDFHHRASVILLPLTAAAAVVTTATGYMAAETIGHDSPGHELVHTHRNLMVAFTILAVIAAALLRDSKKLRPYRIVFIAALAAITMLGADRGALLVFGYGTGVRQQDLHQAPAGDHHHDGEEGGHAESH